MAEIMRIAMFAALLIGVLMLRQPCADSAGRFIQSFEPPATSAPEPQHTLPPGDYVRLTGDMSEAEIRRKINELSRDRDAGTDSDNAQVGPTGADAEP